METSGPKYVKKIFLKHIENLYLLQQSLHSRILEETEEATKSYFKDAFKRDYDQELASVLSLLASPDNPYPEGGTFFHKGFFNSLKQLLTIYYDNEFHAWHIFFSTLINLSVDQDI